LELLQSNHPHFIMREVDNRGKEAAATKAAELIEEGMVLGLGSGSTAALFIRALGKRELEIAAVATSKESEKLAQRVGIEVIDPSAVTHIDMVVDGADEVDPHQNLIKGGGGALLREKIIATIAEEMVVIVDESKLVEGLGMFGLPLEVVPYAHTHTLKQLEELGYDPQLRMLDGQPQLSDNENYIIDLQFSEPMSDPAHDDQRIRSLPGIVETGLFLDLADHVIVGYEDGSVEQT
jgi:ribose 5-phosphate isomerase A